MGAEHLAYDVPVALRHPELLALRTAGGHPGQSNLGFMNNFLKIEKEHITNLSSLKSVSDYKYPFDVKILTRIQEDDEYKDYEYQPSRQIERLVSLHAE
jgi:hypothetical protein